MFESTSRQKWEHIGLSNDFIFGKVMQDPNLCLQLLQRIFFNASGVLDDVSEEMKRFLDYLSGKKSNDSFVEELDNAVQRAKHNREWRQEFMTLEMRDRENFVKGKNTGRAEGRAIEIVEMGQHFGMSTNAILETLQEKLNVTAEKA